MKTVTPTELRANIYNILEEVLRTGVPIEVKKGGKRLKIVPVEPVDKFQNLVSRPDVIQGDPEDLVDIHWENEVHLDLP
ncbi:MAG: type II toxin-antitoxin system Phd/YefM family antitoxin [Chloroflexi bacterium]|nr:type II toxin-antitoxin system Phd/YefM family antitoxin [Chloroflexota bacterium]